jgi:hypothetical protein
MASPVKRTPARIALAISMFRENASYGDILLAVNRLPGPRFASAEAVRCMLVDHHCYRHRAYSPEGRRATTAPKDALSHVDTVIETAEADLETVRAWARRERLPCATRGDLRRINERRMEFGLPPFMLLRDVRSGKKSPGSHRGSV